MNKNRVLSDKNDKSFASFIKSFSMDYPVFYMLIAACVAMIFINPGFYSASNIISMFVSYAYFIVGSIGLIFVFISGNSGIDLSIGQVASFSGIVSMTIMSKLAKAETPMNAWLIILIGLFVAIFVGACFGLLNGFAIAKFNIAPFIITLASQLLAMGLCYVLTNGYTVSGAPREFVKLSTSFGIKIGETKIPWAAIIPFCLFIIMGILLGKTSFGRKVILTGSNPMSAKHAGINVSRVYIIVYLISGIFAGLAGLFLAMVLGSVNPDVGSSILLPMVAAVTIGGISQRGGYGKMLQAALGILFIMVLMTGMTFRGLGLPTQELTYGIVVLVTMTLLGYIEKKRFRI